MTKLLNGWKEIKLGEVSKINYGYTEKASFEEIGPKFLRITDIQNNKVNWESVPFCKCNEIDEQKFLLEHGDIVFARTGATTGKSYLIKNPPKSVFASYLIRLKINSFKILIPEYIMYYFNTQSYWDKINKGTSGSAQGGFNASKLSAINIPLPPLPEQKRIVEILDKAFEEIEKAKAKYEKNLNNAKELFQSKLDEIFSTKGDGWEEKKLKDLGVTQTGTTPKTSDKSNYGNYIPFIKPADVNFNGNGDLRYNNIGLSVSGLKKGRLLKKGSILMVCIGATIGKVGFSYRDVSSNQQINSLTLKNEFEPKFFYYAMVSNQFQEKIISEGKGAQATLPIINKSKWENLTVRYHKSKQIQLELSQKLDKLKSETQKLETTYIKQLENLEELKKSLLDKAFKGEL